MPVIFLSWLPEPNFQSLTKEIQMHRMMYLAYKHWENCGLSLMAVIPATLLGQTEHFQAKENMKMRWLTIKTKSREK